MFGGGGDTKCKQGCIYLFGVSGWGPWKLVFGGVCGTRCKQKHEYLRDCQSSNCIGESSKLTETDCSGGKCGKFMSQRGILMIRVLCIPIVFS